MTNSDILRRVDHTLRAADCNRAQTETLYNEATQRQTASVCTPPNHVKCIQEKHRYLPPLNRVVCLPLEQTAPTTPKPATETALPSGADDTAAAKRLTAVTIYNKHVSVATQSVAVPDNDNIDMAYDNILKVFVEPCHLTQQEKTTLCRGVTDGGTDFLKTVSGFGSGGETLGDILFFKASAAGGQ